MKYAKFPFATYLADAKRPWLKYLCIVFLKHSEVGSSQIGIVRSLPGKVIRKLKDLTEISFADVMWVDSKDVLFDDGAAALAKD